MKKKIHILFFIFCFAQLVWAQGGKWAWMNGNNTYGQGAVFGTKGIAAPANTPGATYETIFWQDHNRCLWIYGGSSLFSDLWKFNPYTNEWAWINGPGISGQSANYGTIGVAAPSNHPGTRGNGTATWVDTNGNLWMFGGLSGSMSNDLWKYDVSSDMWIWMSGSSTGNQPGVYGIQGVPSSSNVPGARYEVIASWTNNGNDLWFYGGFNGNFLNDLWKFDISTNEWTWMNGSSTPSQISVYGTKGVANASNHPGARCAMGPWTDLNGNFWGFGGNGLDLFSVQHCFNDMWKYDPSTNLWTWVHGTQTGSDPGWYGNYCTPTSVSRPMPRYEHYSCASDRCGNFWLYGGGNFITTSTISNTSDLWRYDISTNLWTWISGDSTTNNSPSYGTQFVPSVSNKPGARNGSIAFVDSLNNFWLFGGKQQVGSSFYNDVWKFIVDTSCSTLCSSMAQQPVAGFSSVQTTNCNNVCFSFSDTSANNPTSWQWGFPGAQTTSSSVKNPSTICYSQSGTYTVDLIVCNSAGCDTITKQVQVIVPAPPKVVLGNDTSICSGDSVLLSANTGFTVYQWYLNSVLVTISSNFLTASQGGLYVVTATDANNCSDSDSLLITVSTINVSLMNDTALCGSQHAFILDAGTSGTIYQWFYNGTLLPVNSQTLAANQTGSYWAQVTNNLGCKANDTVNITFYTLPVISTIPDTQVCSSASFTLTTIGAATYTWSPTTYLNSINIASPVSTPLTSITYSVIGKDMNGCIGTDSVVITILPTPVADFTLNLISICSGAEAHLINNSAGASSYIWDFGDGSTSNQLQPIHFYSTSINTIISLVAINGNCRDTTSLIVGIQGLFSGNLPNIFTPNNDGINDCFSVSQGANLTDCFSLVIFNRWGTKVFEAVNNSNCWNGQLNNTGEKAVDGVYFFIAEIAGVNIKGTIQLIR